MKYFYLFIVFLFASPLLGQYPGNGNNWVEYNKTYYKFEVAEDGIYRLNYTNLVDAGIPEADLIGADFQLFHNGIEVPIYVSTDELFSTGDFLEFLGNKNDGSTDTPLYSSPLQQTTNKRSLYTDVGVYFLTISPNNSNERITSIENDLTNLPAKQEYFLHTSSVTGSNIYNGFHRRISGINIFPSIYNDCEGFVINPRINQNQTRNVNIPTPSASVSANIPVTIHFKAFPAIPNTAPTGNIEYSILNQTFQSQINNEFKVAQYQQSFVPGTTIGNQTALSITNNTNSRVYRTEINLTYARNFNFSNNEHFKITGNSSGSQYYELENLSGNEVVVYDLSTNERITETIAANTPIKTSTNSVTNTLFFDTNIQTPVFTATTTFENYVQDTDNLIVIYHPVLETEINGENYIDKYISHRQSTLGGSWSVKKVNINQLRDQFIYGIQDHPAAIKNFLQELLDNGNVPTHVFLIGKGYQYTYLQNNDPVDNYIPTYGYPGSDNLFTANYNDVQMNFAIGRIAARNNVDLKNYVDKVIEYETLMNQNTDADQIKDKLWMKKGIHLAGGGNGSAQQGIFISYLESYEAKFEEPEYGGDISMFLKTSSDPIEVIDIPALDSLINQGVSVINFFGHSSPNAFEFNLNNPDNYMNEGKYPFMFTNGCYVGNLFGENNTLSEDFVLHERGSITFMGPTQFGIAQGMHPFITNFYSLFANTDYGTSIGEAISQGLNDLPNNSQYFILYITKQQMVFHGDPTLHMYNHEKPDYLITPEDISFTPNTLTGESDSFEVHVVVSNIGKAVDEQVPVKISRILPNGQSEVQIQNLEHVYFQDTITFTFETNALVASGLNKFNIEIDADDSLDEITRANNNLINEISRPVVSSILTPIKPANYSIISNPSTTFYAATQEFYPTAKQFQLEIDTTKKFNSPLLVSETITSTGGTIEWQPSITFLDNTVYYWRTKLNEDDQIWTSSSFLFNQEIGTGWNQSHHQQYRENAFETMFVNDNNLFEFSPFVRDIAVQTAIPFALTYYQIRYSIDGVNYDNLYAQCEEANLAVAIINPNTGVPIENEKIGPQQGLYNSVYCDNLIKRIFPYNTETPSFRKDFMDMIDEVPDGWYVAVYSQWPPNPIANNWEGDTALYGYNIFDKLEEQGATQIRNLKDNAPFVFIFQKGNPDFEHKLEVLGQNDEDILDVSTLLPCSYANGTMITDKIGPALSWENFIMNWETIDNSTNGDVVNYSIIGVTPTENETILIENETSTDTDLSFINAQQYPFLKINFYVEDAEFYTPPKLNYWRIMYETAPELAIDISEIISRYPLQYQRGEPFNFDYKLKNISDKDMSPVFVRYTYTKANGEQEIIEQTYDELPAGESQTINYEFDTNCNCLVGNNLFYINANPDFAQIEQEHFNNVGLVEFSIEDDGINPYLDVTFDGIHIINGDLVSDKPNIIISLTDENDYLALDDPEDFEIQVLPPNSSTPIIYTAESAEITFYPADEDDLESENKAVIEFNPQFESGEHELTVQARDASDNLSGDNSYKITFEVTEEDIITQVINYPNPFTTRTEFVANIVGDAPDQILIQIFAPNGKVVRELRSIPSQISVSNGNNFYKIAEWNGTDTFGDPVGNGVYYYKVTLKRNGEIIEPNNSNAYSEYFHNGIGKLYILR